MFFTFRRAHRGRHRRAALFLLRTATLLEGRIRAHLGAVHGGITSVGLGTLAGLELLVHLVHLSFTLLLSQSHLNRIKSKFHVRAGGAIHLTGHALRTNVTLGRLVFTSAGYQAINGAAASGLRHAALTQLQFRMLATVLGNFMLTESLLDQLLVLGLVVARHAALLHAGHRQGRSGLLDEAHATGRNTRPLTGFFHASRSHSARIHRTAAHLLCPATLLHAANVRLAKRLSVRFLHIASDLGIGVGGRLAAGLARLAVGAGRTILALHRNNLAALLVGAARDRAQTRLGGRVQHLRRRPTRRINLSARLAIGQALGLVFHRRTGGLRSFRHL